MPAVVHERLVGVGALQWQREGEQTARRQATRQETRREILDAAWAIARERGLTEITLREVASRVGMRAPSLYSHFDSKLAIYDAMFFDAWTECHQAMRAVAEAELTPDSSGRSTVAA